MASWFGQLLRMFLLLCTAAVLLGCSKPQTVREVPIASLVPTLAPSQVPSPVATALPRPVPSYQPPRAALPLHTLPPLLVETDPLVTETVSITPLTPTLTLRPSPEPTARIRATQVVRPVPSRVAATATAEASPTPRAAAPTEQGYVFPVQAAAGKVSYGAEHHDYPATDIFCPIGSKFVSPIAGVIDFVSAEDRWDAATDPPALRGGISVALIGDDGVRYYGSHLSALAEGIDSGVRVAAGQLLGLTGKSGNAQSTPPHLHFGISHPTTPDDWQTRRGELSPFRYLKAWERGESLAPVLP